MNGRNPEFFDKADKICGIVFDRALLIVHGILIRLGEASTVSDHVILAREGSNLTVPSTIIVRYSMNKYYRFAAASFNISQFYMTKIGNSKIYRLHTPDQIFG
ncbi:hypothetical protein AUI46_04100 [archaeon 13_1_40CM_2_52_13]|nr:MAG: hypothetical protein AUI46_04100 [archaeon 13_1_40CM_2_52_13]